MVKITTPISKINKVWHGTQLKPTPWQHGAHVPGTVPKSSARCPRPPHGAHVLRTAPTSPAQFPRPLRTVPTSPAQCPCPRTVPTSPAQCPRPSHGAHVRSARERKLANYEQIIKEANAVHNFLTS